MVTKKWLTRCRFGALVISGLASLMFVGRGLAEPSLANLLTAAPEADPVTQAADQLAVQLAEIERRPFADASVVQRALAEARAALSHARATYAQGAPDAELQRSLALVRAALSAADRMQARAFAAAALERLKLQAEQAEAAAKVAEAELQKAKAP